MKSVATTFGAKVFDLPTIKDRLPKQAFESYNRTLMTGAELPGEVITAIAQEMKDWALENGATHFTHWFQPMTNSTAGKLDSFIAPDSAGYAIMEFSPRELMRGESDASSFPSGGLRTTDAARGYTTWDPTSFSYIKDNVLYIPTVFTSYNGEALDKKTPLLRSEQALGKQAIRLLRAIGNSDIHSVRSTTGIEQEYFLIDEQLFALRPDLRYCSRTMFGAPAVIGNEIKGHYMGSVHPRISAFMQELEQELWQLGIYAKTFHNEVSPSQYEIVPVFTSSNMALDHNQITMDLLKTIARRHGLVCLLHEKPFAGLNGSGKHINWSLSADNGDNLLSPGENPEKNLVFLLVMAALLRGVDKYGFLLRLSTATASNDLRLGGHEAPPAIISVFLGDELTQLLLCIADGEHWNTDKSNELMLGAKVLPLIPRDISDRNRTSPIAFTGGKFEFRMPGSSLSAGGPMTVINTIVADGLQYYADQLEGCSDIDAAVHKLLRSEISTHQNIIFNGDNYSESWRAQALSRGLGEYKTLPDVLPLIKSSDCIELFRRHKVLSPVELASRYNILLEAYADTLATETKAQIEIINRLIIPACIEYQNELARLLERKSRLGYSPDPSLEWRYLNDISEISSRLVAGLDELAATAKDFPAPGEMSIADVSNYLATVRPKEESLRSIADRLETLIGKEYWKLPGYNELLNSVY